MAHRAEIAQVRAWVRATVMLFLLAGATPTAVCQRASARQWDRKLTATSMTITFREADFPPDIRRWYRETGGWEFPFPVTSPYYSHAYCVDNLARWEERTDSAGNRWLKLLVKDVEQPMHITVITENREAQIDVSAFSWETYSVPPRHRPYLGKTENCDPTLGGAQRMASPLKATTLEQTLRNVWAWTNTIHYGDSGVPNGDLRRPVSEDALNNGKGVCLHQATATVALLRAMGLAARAVRGHSHSWCEVWLPRVGWHIIQQNVPLARAGWLDGYLAEPIDDSSMSPLLRWKISNHWYTAQFLDFYLSFHTTPKTDVPTPDGYEPILRLAARHQPPGATLIGPKPTAESDELKDLSAYERGQVSEGRPSLSPDLAGWRLVSGDMPVVQADAAGSYLTTRHPTLGATATCELQSPPFTIAGDTLTVEVAGADAKDAQGEPTCCVGLIVDDATVLKACGQGDTTLRPVKWDVAKWKGKEARLVVVDRMRSGRPAFVMLGEKIAVRQNGATTEAGSR